MKHYDEIIIKDGYRFGVSFTPDLDTGEPWLNNDGHGIVSRWTNRPKTPGERILTQDRAFFRYYDWEATIAKAHREEWGVKGGQLDGETVGAYRARAVQADFDYLAAWCRDEWRYLSVDVALLDEAGDPVGTLAESLSGVDGYDGYELQVRDELIGYLLTRLQQNREHVIATFGPDPFGLETIGAAPRDAFGKPREVYYLVRVTDIEVTINAKSAEMAEAKLRGFLAGLRGRPGIVTWAGLTVETIARS